MRELVLLNKKKIIQYVNNKHQLSLDGISIFDELPSTNSYLAEQIKTAQGAAKSQIKVCFAECQTAGRGRLGKRWFSPRACSIYLSLGWQFQEEAQDLGGLGLLAAIAVIEALEKYGVKDELSLKWPNDILWCRRKLAGILVELVCDQERKCSAVIGVGLNVHLPKEAGKEIDQPWCDIAQITAASPARNKLAGLLLDRLFATLTTFQMSGLGTFIKKWRKFDITYGKKITVTSLTLPEKRVSGVSLGINDRGHLLLKSSEGKSYSFTAGEVSLSGLGSVKK